MNNKNSSNSNSNLTNITNLSSSSSRPTSCTTTTTTTTQACAACKYQRRKCNPDCILAPYFPADHQRQFLNAHRLFGVSNIVKIIRCLDPHRRAEAMKSIIFESNCRAADPIGGCYRVIVDLERQIDHDYTELTLVCNHLAMYQAQARAQQAQHENLINNDVGVATTENDAAAAAALYGNNLMLQQQQQQQQQQYLEYLYFDAGSGGGGGDTNENIGENNIENNNNGIVDSSNNNNISMSSGSVSNNNIVFGINNNDGMNEVVGSAEDVKPLVVDMFDITHALAIGDEEGEAAAAAAGESSYNRAALGSYYCSNEAQSKEEPNPMEHVQEHDLKGAASLFTLTSRNSSYV